MLILKEHKNGFDIRFFALQPDGELSDQYMYPDDLAEVLQKIEIGEWLHFGAKIVISKDGIDLAEEYLGQCIYTSYMDFVLMDDYYSQMCDDGIVQATKVIKKLYSGLE